MKTDPQSFLFPHLTKQTQMILWKRIVVLMLFFCCILKNGLAHDHEYQVLVFSKTSGFRHDSITNGIAAIRTLGTNNHFSVEASEDGAVFSDANLAQYKAVVFLSTTGDVLDSDQQAAFERYIRAGGGFVGIHAASDTEYNWPWYGGLVGAYFSS